MEKIKVLIVDDSLLVRQALTGLLSSDKDIEVIGTANDPYEAADFIRETLPDVITLDIEMPKMDGLTFLKKIMSQHPIPVVIISRIAERGSQKAIQAMEYGAVDVILKPQINTTQSLEDVKIMLCDTVKAASKVKLKRISPQKKANVTPKLDADAVISKKNYISSVITSNKIIALGASTGGTDAIANILQNLNKDCHGIVIVQHMPEFFTKAFADRLNDLYEPYVKEAEDGDIIKKGCVFIAPGNKHMLVKNNGLNYYIEIKDGPLVNRHRPSVDVLFRSVAQCAGKNALGILLTGMGDDGAKGLLEMRESGAFTIAQDANTSVVFGMPKEAIAIGGAEAVLPIDLISNYILNFK
jgi:two-component system chemotaxis response regulator CheB